MGCWEPNRSLAWHSGSRICSAVGSLQIKFSLPDALSQTRILDLLGLQILICFNKYHLISPFIYLGLSLNDASAGRTLRFKGTSPQNDDDLLHCEL